MNIGPLKVGPGEPCAIVAEIGNAHNGDFTRAIRLLDAAKACGASAAKLQAYTPAELVSLRGDGPAPEPWGSQGWTMLSLYQKARTPLRWLPSLYDYAATIGLPLFSSVFGLESLAMLEDCGNPAYKISKFEFDGKAARELFYAAARTGKPIIASTADAEASVGLGGAIVSPMEEGPTTVLSTLALLYCPGSYPCAIEDVHLPEFNTLRYKQRGHLGLSSHCLDLRLPVAAVARGAKVLEYHFMLDEEPSELEATVSLGESAFAEMVRNVRATEVLLAH